MKADEMIEVIRAVEDGRPVDTAKKNRNKAKAQELHPELKITHAIADAILICEYGIKHSLHES